jgi:hypothetical protein
MRDRETKSVSFSSKDLNERQMFEYITNFTFSDYVKRLIFLDMNKGATTFQSIAPYQMEQPNISLDPSTFS